MKSLLILGLIGGLSWHSTSEYYRYINSSVQSQLGEYRSAPLLISSVDFGPIVEHQLNKDWDKAGRILAEEAKKLEAAGAQAIMICSNTMHKVSPQVEEAVDIPLIHMATAIAREMKRRDKSEAILLGTRYTMADNFLYDALDTEGIIATPPARSEAKAINLAIFKRLVRGTIVEADQQLLTRIAKESNQRPNQALVLGCTELGLLITEETPQTNIIDSATAHAKLAVEYILGQYQVQPLRRHPQSWVDQLDSATPRVVEVTEGQDMVGTGLSYPDTVPKVLEDINNFSTDQLRRTLSGIRQHLASPDSLEFEWDNLRIYVLTERQFSIVEDLGGLEPRFQIATEELVGLLERTLVVREEAIAKLETEFLTPEHFSRGS